MKTVDGKMPGWRFDAECLVWETAHAVPDDAPETEFWRIVADFAAERICSLPTASGAEVARWFLRWVRDHEMCGSMSSAEMTAAFVEYSSEAPHAEIHENTMRRHLITLPGVHKVQEDQSDRGSRRRRFTWVIDID